jgi:2-methylisocitrate lyase-like PEP mutase family enzyme
MNKFQDFIQLHQQETPLLLGNVWNAHSAKIFAKAGFQALGTSSAAVANTLGYDDGENISFNELLFVVERIIRHTSLPLTVDMEAGYGKSLSEIVDNLKKLIALGVVGINLEDSIPQKKQLIPIADYCEKINFIKQELNKAQLDIFINARTDAYLLGVESPLAETLARIEAYQIKGADGIFVPCIVDRMDISQVVKASRLPINVMCMPTLPTFQELRDLGVKRISMGNFVYSRQSQELALKLEKIQQEGSFHALFI